MWAAGVPRTTHLGDLGAQGGVLVGVLQEVDHLLQLQLRAVHALHGNSKTSFLLAKNIAFLVCKKHSSYMRQGDTSCNRKQNDSAQQIPPSLSSMLCHN